mmetsp:Transcript_32951/g.43741  ORF Transcript_32951/g.43741 Transcript_32951/m.43741 type:complete len:88 (-) Transcript_32951:454-717(-)
MDSPPVPSAWEKSPPWRSKCRTNLIWVIHILDMENVERRINIYILVLDKSSVRGAFVKTKLQNHTLSHNCEPPPPLKKTKFKTLPMR